MMMTPRSITKDGDDDDDSVHGNDDDNDDDLAWTMGKVVYLRSSLTKAVFLLLHLW